MLPLFGCVRGRKMHRWLGLRANAPSQPNKWSRAFQSDIFGRQHRMVRERVRRSAGDCGLAR